MEALDYEDWVEEGAGTGGHLGPVLRCCRPTLGLHSNRGWGVGWGVEETKTTTKKKNVKQCRNNPDKQ